MFCRRHSVPQYGDKLDRESAVLELRFVFQLFVQTLPLRCSVCAWLQFVMNPIDETKVRVLRPIMDLFIFPSDVLFAKQQFLASASECGTPEPWKEGLSSDRNLSNSEGLDPTPPISPRVGRPPQLTFSRSHLDCVCREYCRVRMYRSLSVLFQSGIGSLSRGTSSRCS